MERAILKTLTYADIFDYPLTLRELHKWLINEKCDLRTLEKALNRLNKKSKIGYLKDFYFLKGRENIVLSRIRKSKQSAVYIRKANLISKLLKIIPWIKLVGISGGLSMENSGKDGDIDLVLITAKNKIWLTRFLTLFLLQITGQRRKVTDSKRKAAGKICCNLIMEEDFLEQKKKDLYSAHEVLQMRILWERDGVYSKYLSDNEWVFKFLPNWIGDKVVNGSKPGNKKSNLLDDFLLWLENLAKKFQLMVMKPSQGMERIEKGALYFHPTDYRKQILTKFREKLSRS